jgi:plasmid stabilization system protein ParE
LIAFTPEARRQVRALRQYYDEHERLAALRALASALESAWEKIVANPAIGLAAPRPYPELAHPDRAWLKQGRYWIAYSTAPPVIVGVFYETPDIPQRM